jgi:hypothetical protein
MGKSPTLFCRTKKTRLSITPFLVPSDSKIPSDLFFNSSNMADADEDVIHAPANASTQPEVDLSDETQDFRFLNHLNLYDHGLFL